MAPDPGPRSLNDTCSDCLVKERSPSDQRELNIHTVTTSGCASATHHRDSVLHFRCESGHLAIPGCPPPPGRAPVEHDWAAEIADEVRMPTYPVRMQPTATLPGITLDRDSEPWVGTFPGIGRVMVAADGTVDVTMDAVESGTVGDESGHPADASTDAQTSDTLELREAALRHGWGEPLSWARRGFVCLGGGAVTPDPSVGCILITGELHEFGRVLPELARRGWGFLSDRFTPAQWAEGSFVAHPVAAPLLLSTRRARAAGWTGAPVRGATDALAVALRRVPEPTRVAGVVTLARRRVGEPAFEVLTGHRRFEVAANLRIDGALAPTGPDAAAATDPGQHLAEQLRLAALPTARWRADNDDDAIPADVDHLQQWWREITGSAS